jgi:hypothetical protein
MALGLNLTITTLTKLCLIYLCLIYYCYKNIITWFSITTTTFPFQVQVLIVYKYLNNRDCLIITINVWRGRYQDIFFLKEIVDITRIFAIVHTATTPPIIAVL